MAAARSTANPGWGTPTIIGRAAVTSFDLAAAVGAGEVIGAWAEARSRRADGMIDSVCVVAGTASGGVATRRDLACRGDASVDGVRLVQAAGGATLAAWQTVPFFGASGRLRSSIEVSARAPGAAAWSPAQTAVADALGYHDLEDLKPITDGRSLLAADLSASLRLRDDGRIRVVVLGTDGSVVRRLGGPPTPGRPPHLDQRLVVLRGGHGGAILLWPIRGTAGYRASVLTLGS